ncbi:neurensin-2 isoform X3 [Panthera tigris]|uniref:neurensin-2 isoform X3 n=1 Tax=Panthera leo TaxID=9689 RepID=UPI001C695024|nr:neurensin-2 isoform X3 [Panthera leo]XP_042835656.1 neurensin-2 isoform X3 [Panthera tigris]
MTERARSAGNGCFTWALHVVLASSQHGSLKRSMMPNCDRSCGCSRGPNVEDGKWYGVRSYLHLFYEDCAGMALSDDPEGPPVLCPRRPWPSLCWKISLSTGTLLLLLGVAALTTGYAVPPKLEGIGEGEFLVLDQRAADYNQALGTCRLAGTVLCVAAGILLAICLVWAVAGWLSQDTKAEPLDAEADGHVEIFGDEPEQQLSPIFRDANGYPQVLTSPCNKCALLGPQQAPPSCSLPGQTHHLHSHH